MSDSIPLLRQWTLLKTLSSRRNGVTLRAMSADTTVSSKTILRDLHLLRRVGFPIEENVTDHGRKHWKLGNADGLPALNFTLEEAAALYLGRQFLECLAGTLFWSGAQSAFQKIKSALGDPALRHLQKLAQAVCLQTQPFTDYTARGKLIDDLMVAIEDRRLTVITYHSLRSTEPVTLYDIHPTRWCTIAVRCTWGVDLVAGNARVLSSKDAKKMRGERWRPTKYSSPAELRVPAVGTLLALRQRHEQFLSRLSDGSLDPVYPLPTPTVFNYRRDFEPAQPSFAAFQFLQVDGDGMRAFNTARRACSVAGMLRHATGQAAKGWEPRQRSQVVFGHASMNGEPELNCAAPAESPDPQFSTQPADDVVGRNRFAYLPLPSLEFRGKGLVVGSIRRALIVSFSNDLRDEIRWVRRALSGRDLLDVHNGESQAMLAAIPDNDKMVKRYVHAAPTWSTVTPVILPGRDDRNHKKAERLLRKAITHAGFSETLANCADLDWRSVGFWPGADLAQRYFVPKHLQGYPGHPP